MILVTGGAGFIGSNVVASLNEAGRGDVAVNDWLGSDGKWRNLQKRQVADMVNISSVAGRVARSGSGVYNATKHAVGAFSEALRQEVTGRYVRISLVEPGAVATELAGHNRPQVLETIAKHWRLDSDAEITLEANPTSVEAERFAGYPAAGVNRRRLRVNTRRRSRPPGRGRRRP